MNNKKIIICILCTCMSLIELSAGPNYRCSNMFCTKLNSPSQIIACLAQGKPVNAAIITKTYNEQLQKDPMLARSLLNFHLELQSDLTNLDEPTKNQAMQLLKAAFVKAVKGLPSDCKVVNLREIIQKDQYRGTFCFLLGNMPEVIEDLFSSYLKEYSAKEALICNAGISGCYNKYKILSKIMYKAVIKFLKDLTSNVKKPEPFLPFLLSTEFLELFEDKKFLKFIGNSSNFGVVGNMLTAIQKLPIEPNEKESLTDAFGKVPPKFSL